VLLVVTYSAGARASLRNVRRAHDDCVVRWFGRAALLEGTELGAFLALRLREKHPGDVGIERTRPFNEFRAVPEAVREAAEAYEDREVDSVPYAAFAAGTDHPAPERMAEREL
jgi:hypothetical protein